MVPAIESINESVLKREHFFLSDINLSLTNKSSYRKNKNVYHSYTDNPSAVEEAVDFLIEDRGEVYPWNGHIVGTLGAGWPLLFLKKFAQRVTVVEINYNQILSVFSKLEEKGELDAAKEVLVQSDSLMMNEDITRLTQDFWDESLKGNEIIWLSNIYDHAVDYKFYPRFINMLKLIKKAVKPGQRVDIVFTYRNYDYHRAARTNIQKRLKSARPVSGFVINEVLNGTMVTENSKYAEHNITVVSIENTSEA